MKNIKKSLKRKALRNIVEIKTVLNASIQPFVESPSIRNIGENLDRINAHDLFSHYTADIIKEDIIFIR